MSRRAVAVIASAVTLATLPPSTASAQRVANVDAVATRGFDDSANKYAWSMAWFKGRLYVGTGRENSCVEAFTIDFYKVLPFPFYSQRPAPDIRCPADAYDLDLRAEIWQYTPSTQRWKRVYRSPQDLPNPRAPGKFVARDIGFRGMVVHGGALYVGGLTANEYIPELAADHAPRLLRTTDGQNFEPVAGVPTTVESPWGTFRSVGFRALVNYRGRLFATITTGALGDGVVVEANGLGSAAPTFRQITPGLMRVFELATYDGSLYLGTGDEKQGYAVYRTDDATESTPTFTPIVTGGAGRGTQIASVVSMHVFRGRLYVGANGYASLLPQAELIRINPDDSWDLVVGNWRFAPGGQLKLPLSGLPDGFGNYFTSHMWRETVSGGTMYLGTLDSAWGLRVFPIVADAVAHEMGFDIYATCDGTFWWRVTKDGLGLGRNNIGARTMESTSAGNFLGSFNPVEGATVWRDRNPSPCATPPARARVRVRAERFKKQREAVRPPAKVLAELQRAGAVVSWSPVRGARGYRVLRARYDDVLARVPARRRGGFVGDFAPDVSAWTGPAMTRTFPVASAYTAVGTVRQPVFVDRTARPGRRYAYLVEAIGGDGRSAPSNLAMALPGTPPPTFAAAAAIVDRLPASRRHVLRAALERAQGQWRRDERAAALRTLAALRRSGERATARASSVRRGAVEQDVTDAVLRLSRHVRYAGVADR